MPCASIAIKIYPPTKERIDSEREAAGKLDRPVIVDAMTRIWMETSARRKRQALLDATSSISKRREGD